MDNSNQPGVSGKSQNGKSWFNQDKFAEQLDDMEATGSQKLQGKTDLSNQGEQETNNSFADEIFNDIKVASTVDVSQIMVSEESGVVTLRGFVEDAKESRAIEKIVTNIRGVKKVENKIQSEIGHLI